MQLKLGKQRNKKNDTARLQLIEITKKNAKQLFIPLGFQMNLLCLLDE